MVRLEELVRYCDALLNVADFQDYCPNGLQVEGRAEISSVVTGVTASLALIEAAIERNADLLLVHHGFFWRGEDPRLVGMKGRRLKALMRADLSLVAYHLPLDAHPELGNNARLAAELGFAVEGRFGPADIAFFGRPEEPLSADQLADHLASVLGRPPLHIPGGPDLIRRVGWCSGAAQGYIEQAAALGLDAFISGEISEQTVHISREMGVNYFASGHHATERFGVVSLGQQLAAQFGVHHEFVEIPNPV